MHQEASLRQISARISEIAVGDLAVVRVHERGYYPPVSMLCQAEEPVHTQLVKRCWRTDRPRMDQAAHRSQLAVVNIGPAVNRHYSRCQATGERLDFSL